MKPFLPLSILGVAYLGLAALPAETLWFDPGEVRIQDAPQGTAPAVEYTRHIKRPAMISYSVVVRDEANETACEARSGPFTYGPINAPLLGKDLLWWAAGESRCGNLPRGTYWAETCWRVVTPLRSILPEFLKTPLGWLLPPKSVCRISTPFTIT